MRLKDKVAIVTGASAGIGQAIAKAFAAEGAHLTLAAVDRPEQMEADAAEFRRMGQRALALTVDVSRVADIKRMVDATVAELGRVDILVNNAGIRIYFGYGEVPEEDYDRLMAVNLKAPFFAGQFVIPHMKKQGGGKIIHMASQLGLVGAAGSSAYCTAKGGLINLTHTMALELAQHNIHVNAIAPGPIATEFFLNRTRIDPAALEARMRHLPCGRLGRPEEIAAAAVYLASDESSYCHGTILVVDGGYISG
ncbi:MAG: SDR family NAD(P)-dependent oxidoreductase [Gemmatimonadales bacterium]